MERGKAVTLSAGTLNIISTTNGVLPSSQLRNFLNQVRGRKKAMEIAGHFTSNIPALVKQLKKVEANYYKQGRKGSRMDKDIDFIRRLAVRLDRDSNADHCVSNQDHFFEEYHNEDAYRAMSSDSGRTQQVFASTSSYKRIPNKAPKKQSTKRQETSLITGVFSIASTGSSFQSVYASTSSCAQTSAKPVKKQSNAKGTASLGSGIRNIILNTGGHLPPQELCNFLNQVRGKKKAEEIARRFTSNISSLVKQLRKVEANYYKQGRKGTRMDKDIEFIRRLSDRLQPETSEKYVMEKYSREMYFQGMM